MLPLSTLESYPQPDAARIDELLRREIEQSALKVVVLDDDPTGVQTVHDISVYTDWSYASILEGFREAGNLFYVLTNSRSFTAAQTAQAHREIAAAVARAARETGKRYLLISRSDSTLRGHYPLETAVLREALAAAGQRIDGEFLCPFFKEGGRFTIGNVHYVRQAEGLVPAAETEFAKDKTFGYTHSAIPDYIEEKTGGAYRAADVCCISLEALRALDVDGIQAQLQAVHDFGKVCVNAIDACDAQVFAIALYRAVANGKRFLGRTAAGLVKALCGVSDIPLLTRAEIVTQETDNGGIVVVGSHTQKTTAQLRELLKLPCAVPIEFRSDLVLAGDDAFGAEIDRCVAAAEQAVRAGKTAVCYTARKLLEVENDTPEKALVRAVKISDGVQALIGRLRVAPAFIVAKGGITSADVGTKALRVRRANVMGQIRPGVPVWQTGRESKFPQIPYVIFPGNVGEAGTLREAVEILNAK